MTPPVLCALRYRIAQDFAAGRKTNREERLLARKTCRCPRCASRRRRQQKAKR